MLVFLHIHDLGIASNRMTQPSVLPYRLVPVPTIVLPSAETSAILGMMSEKMQCWILWQFGETTLNRSVAVVWAGSAPN